MVVNILIDEKLEKDEILIRCKELNNEIMEIYYSLLDKSIKSKNLTLKKDDTEYYIKLDEIIFFETDNNCISAHTINEIYTSNYKLYELEKILPRHFIRISKSSILNINHVYSIKKTSHLQV